MFAAAILPSPTGRILSLSSYKTFIDVLRWHNTATGGTAMSGSTTQHLSGLSIHDQEPPHGHNGHHEHGHHLAPAPAQYRARSPSPLDGPSHHHLIMETRKISSHNNNVTHDQDVSTATNHVSSSAPAHIPNNCSSQLAKVLEKQIEVGDDRSIVRLWHTICLFAE